MAGFDPYAFVNNTPSTNVDPNGLCSFDNLSGDSCWPFPVFMFDLGDPFSPTSPWTIGRQDIDPTSGSNGGGSYVTPVPAIPYQDMRYNYDHSVRGEAADWTNNLDQARAWPRWDAPTTFGMNWDAADSLREGFTQGNASNAFAIAELLAAAQMAIVAAPFLTDLGAEFGESVLGHDGLLGAALKSPFGAWVNPALYSSAGALMVAAVDIFSETPSGIGASMLGGARPFGDLSRAADYGIKPYEELRAALKGTDLQAHHLIEQRFAGVMGQDPAKMLSVAVTPGAKGEHQVFTNAWRSAIPYREGTANATVEQITSAARQIYADYPAILRALGL
jgi:hypothetical protein